MMPRAKQRKSALTDLGIPLTLAPMEALLVVAAVLAAAKSSHRSLGVRQSLFWLFLVLTPITVWSVFLGKGKKGDRVRRIPIAEMAMAVSHDGGLGGCDDDLEFEFGLDLILDGFERLRATA